MGKTIIKTLILSFLAGILISIGGTVFLSTESKYLGAFLFAIGLFFIVECGFKLYTGAIGYLLSNDKENNIMLIFILIGNLLGTLFTSLILHFTRIFDAISTKAKTMVDIKLNDNIISILILSIMCGILIYLGVDTYKKSNNNFSKVLAIILCVWVFIISGFEHCIANMFYISIADMWSLKAVSYVLIMVIGNSLGGILIPALKLIITKLDNKLEEGENNEKTN